MNVITIQSEVWESLQKKIEAIQEKVEQEKRKEWEQEWIDNETFLKRLGISRKTGQTYRDQGLISFSQIGNKIYYRNKDVEALLLKHHIKARGGEK
jgi:hypothetical protein